MNTDTLTAKFEVQDSFGVVVYATLFAALAVQYLLDHQGMGLTLVWPL
jgi:hypothetical protein